MNRKYRNRGQPQKQTPAPEAKSKLSEMLDIPAAAMTGEPQMEISGNHEAVIDGCRGVLVYDETMIRLAANDMIITFVGRGLQIKVLTHNSAIIGGFITSIDFST